MTVRLTVVKIKVFIFPFLIRIAGLIVKVRIVKGRHMVRKIIFFRSWLEGMGSGYMDWGS